MIRRKHHCVPPNQKNFVCVISLCLIGLLYVAQQRVVGSIPRTVESSSSSPTRSFNLNSDRPQYACPSKKVVAENIAAATNEHSMWYDLSSKQIKSKNIVRFFDDFRETDFDNWGHTYNEVKHGMYHWKSNSFGSLEDGDLVYESASGIGLNLYMTLEIMHETKGLKNLTVYGNEYVRESVEIAKAITGGTADHTESFLPAGGNLGIFCEADSTRLSFVPSNSFHLVYTGYISPLFNPLHLSGTTDENFAQYSVDCQEHEKVAQQAQEIQNEWYAAWVGEMVRIAKPGAPVIVEQVSYPLCEAMFDWGGVSPDFWTKAVPNYGWDVDQSTIRTETDKIFRRRYHVFMRKSDK